MPDPCTYGVSVDLTLRRVCVVIKSDELEAVTLTFPPGVAAAFVNQLNEAIEVLVPSKVTP